MSRLTDDAPSGFHYRPQRADDWGIRLIRTGMENEVVMGDILWGIEHYGLTTQEIADALHEQNEFCQWHRLNTEQQSFKQLIGTLHER